jgi:glycosyltransferase 2 family protein
MTKTILGWAKLIFTPVALGFLTYFVWLSRHELSSLLSEASLSLLAAALFAWCLFNLATPLLALILLGACGSKVSWWQSFSTHAARLPARYVPGGVWHTVGRVMDYRQAGVARRHLTSFVVMENGLAAAVAMAVGGAAVFVSHSSGVWGNVAGVSSLAGVIAIPVMWVLVNRSILTRPDRITLAKYGSAVGVMTVLWGLATSAFLLYLNAFPYTFGDHTQVEMGGIYLFSWGVGFLSIFAPQGIGVFEMISSELTQSAIGFAGFAALIGGFRLVVLTADLVVWIVYQSLRNRSVKNPITDGQ